MSNDKNMPFGISLFLMFLFALEVVYFFLINLTMGIFPFYDYPVNVFSGVWWQMLVVVFLSVGIFWSLYLILTRFIIRESAIRKWTMVFIMFTALWPLWGMIVNCMFFLHLVIFVIDILMIVYLMTEYVKEYFREIEIFRYGEWTLYVRMVLLKNDEGERPIYFFSKKEPKSGTPCAMPEGYEVGISDRSSMPYLQRIGKPDVYKYGDYTLYTRKVKLVRGNEVDIYFFSGHKPKSGKACSMPEGYEVGINKRSNMPYLKKKGKRKTTKVVETKIETSESKRKPANVIYVVSKPQPGEVRGDWAVRSHGKIYSHHKTKETAIKEARKVARKKNATVLVQNTDGTFSDGFKPRSK